MIRAYACRGLAAGLCAGVLAGLVGLLLGAPALDAAERLEQAAASPEPDAASPAPDHDGESAAASRDAGHGDHADESAQADEAHPVDEPAHADAPADAEPAGASPLSRAPGSVGLIAGNGLAGAAVGLVFGVVAAWAAGRLRGDGWRRSLELGGTALAALVVLPFLAYPPTPPGAGDPDSVGLRAALLLATVVSGIALAVVGRLLARRLAGTGMLPALRQSLVGLVVVGVAALLLVVFPSPASVGATAPQLPSELVWHFRLGTLATQATLVIGTAVVFGLLTARVEAQGPAAEAGATVGGSR